MTNQNNAAQAAQQHPIDEAIVILTEEAAALRECHTPSGDRDDWTGESEAKGAHDNMLRVADALSKLRAPVVGDAVAWISIDAAEEAIPGSGTRMIGFKPHPTAYRNIPLGYIACGVAALASAPVAGEAPGLVGYYTDWAGERRYARAPHEIDEPGLTLTFTPDNPASDYWRPCYAAPQARPSDDKLWDQTLTERDEYHDMADKLANAIADHLLVEIGEHSSGNCPWMRALEAIENAPPQASAEDVRNAAPGFGLDAGQLECLRGAGLKPEEIAGAPEVQHARVLELLHWFARLALGRANPKWAMPHAYELAYYVATEGADRGIDLEAIKNAAYLDGVDISAADRGILERLGKIEPAAQPTRPCSCPGAGDGSLRHPCAVHPPADQASKKPAHDERQAWAADMVAAGAKHLGDECWEWESDDFLFHLWQVATGRQNRAARADTDKKEM